LGDAKVIEIDHFTESLLVEMQDLQDNGLAWGRVLNRAIQMAHPDKSE
jgi:hypothetical protein